ncbi:hypothetical protein HanIR_Chr16g0830781 [Helianthus annuus]|nr:hypothetical protein HanIR_Chr16g0830781 [Helianthus annuus]
MQSYLLKKKKKKKTPTSGSQDSLLINCHCINYSLLLGAKDILDIKKKTC